MAALIVGLAVLATLPILQFLSLGYLLESAGRIARERRLASGFGGRAQGGPSGRAGVGGVAGAVAAARGVVAVGFRAADRAGQPRRSWLVAGAVGAQRVAGRSRDRRLLARRRVAALSLAAADLAGAADRFAAGRTRTLATRSGISSSGCGCRTTSGWDCGDSWAAWRGCSCPISMLAAGAKAPLVGFVGALLLGNRDSVSALCASAVRGREPVAGDVSGPRQCAIIFAVRRWPF